MKYRRVQQMDAMEHQCKRSDSKRMLKRLANRAMRRAAKADPENAPVKARYRGWSF